VVSLQLRPHDPPELVEQVTPASIAEVGGDPGRSDDVEEQDRGQCA
jgi:hypothetical protein